MIWYFDEQYYTTFIVPTIILLIGALIRGIIVVASARKKRKTLRQVYHENLKGIVRNSLKQAKLFDNYVKSIDVQGNFIITILEIPQLSIIKEIGYKELFFAYFSGVENTFICNRKLKLKAFQALWVNSMNIAHWITKSKIDVDTHLQGVNQKNQLRNKHVGELLEEMIKYLTSTSEALALGATVSPEELIFFKALDNIFLTWKVQDNNTNPEIVDSFLVLKMIELLNAGSPIQVKTNFNFKAINANHYYNEILKQHKVQKENFIIYKRFVEGSCKIIHKANFILN